MQSWGSFCWWWYALCFSCFWFSAFLIPIVASDFVVGNCFERLPRRDPERSWFLFLGWFKLVSLFMLVRMFFCQQVQWLPRWLNFRCWSRVWVEVLLSWLRMLLVGLKRLVGYGWKVIVEWDWFCCGWRWSIVLLLLRRRVVWGWKSVWGWEIGCLGLRDGLVGVDRYKRTKVHFVHLQLLQASGSSYCNHATPPLLQKWKKNWNLKCNFGPLATWPHKVMQNRIRTKS